MYLAYDRIMQPNETIEITSHFAHNDYFLKKEVEAGGLGGRLYGDEIAHLMVVRHGEIFFRTLLPHYSNHSLPLLRLNRTRLN